MKISRLIYLFIIQFFVVSLCAQAENGPKKNWKNMTEFSYVSANGNSKSASTAGKNTFNYDWTKTSFELIAGGMGSRSEQGVTAEQYYASEKLSYALSDLNYMYEKGGWDKNRFAGINNRYDITAGFGRKLLKLPKDLLVGEIGAGYVNEDRINAPINDFGSGRLYGKYTRTISPTSSFSQDAEYIQSVDDGKDFRVNTETSLLAAISNHLALKLGYQWKFVNMPPPGYGRNDTITTMSLVASF